MFSFVQCKIAVPKKLKQTFCNFPPILEKISVNRKGIRKLMRRYAEDKGLMSQTPKMLISSFTLQNGTVITLLLFINLKLDVVCTKRTTSFNKLPRSVLIPLYNQLLRGTSDGNPNSSLVAEMTKPPASSSCDYQLF